MQHIDMPLCHPPPRQQQSRTAHQHDYYKPMSPKATRDRSWQHCLRCYPREIFTNCPQNALTSFSWHILRFSVQGGERERYTGVTLHPIGNMVLVYLYEKLQSQFPFFVQTVSRFSTCPCLRWKSRNTCITFYCLEQRASIDEIKKVLIRFLTGWTSDHGTVALTRRLSSRKNYCPRYLLFSIPTTFESHTAFIAQL